MRLSISGTGAVSKLDIAENSVRRRRSEGGLSKYFASLHADLYPIVDRLHQILLRSEIPFRRLNRGVAEQQLDLLQIPSRFAAEFRAGPAAGRAG